MSKISAIYIRLGKQNWVVHWLLLDILSWKRLTSSRSTPRKRRVGGERSQSSVAEFRGPHHFHVHVRRHWLDEKRQPTSLREQFIVCCFLQRTMVIRRAKMWRLCVAMILQCEVHHCCVPISFLRFLFVFLRLLFSTILWTKACSSEDWVLTLFEWSDHFISNSILCSGFCKREWRTPFPSWGAGKFVAKVSHDEFRKFRVSLYHVFPWLQVGSGEIWCKSAMKLSNIF